MWSLTSLRTKRISSFRKFRLLPPKDFFDSIGQNRKSSMRAYVFRCALESGHRMSVYEYTPWTGKAPKQPVG
jgi:hypothetical protein